MWKPAKIKNSSDFTVTNLYLLIFNGVSSAITLSAKELKYWVKNETIYFDH